MSIRFGVGGVSIGALTVALLLVPSTGGAKTLVYCSEGSPETFNSSLTTSLTSFDVSLPVHNNLVEFERGGTGVVPGLASSWDVSADGLTYVFHLRSGVKFHSVAGFSPTRDFNADDVLFSINRQWKPDNPYFKVSGGTYDYFNDTAMSKLLKSVEKVDEHTVKITLSEVQAPFIANLAMPMMPILSAEYAEVMLRAGTPERVDRVPVGTGPFQFVAYQKDISVRYKAFDAFWGGRQPIDNLIFAITPDPAVRLAKLRAGECHVVPFPNPADIPVLERDPDVRLTRQTGMNVGYISFNVLRKPVDDVRVRRALSMAIDKKSILDAVFQGGGEAAATPIPPSVWGHDAAVTGYPYNPVEAKRLLAEAGYPDGFKMDLWAMPVQRPYNPNARRMAEMIQSDFAKIGVRAEVVQYEWGEYRKRLHQGEHTAGMLGWTGSNGDPDNFMFTLLGCEAARPGGNNISGWCDKEFDDLVVRAQRAFDRAERTKLYERAQEVFKREAPWYPVAHSTVYMALSPRVVNYKLDPFGYHRFQDVDIK